MSPVSERRRRWVLFKARWIPWTKAARYRREKYGQRWGQRTDGAPTAFTRLGLAWCAHPWAMGYAFASGALCGAALAGILG